MLKEKAYGKFKYIQFTPTDKSTAGLPMIVVMHGSGEIGSSLSKLKKREPYISMLNGKFNPDAVVLMPQLPKKSWGYYAAELKALIDHVGFEELKCDMSRVSLTGHSLGGMGVIEVMLKYPNMFSAGAALSCCKDYKKDLMKLAHMPLWFIHGAKESSYGKYAKSMYGAMDKMNTAARYTSIPGYGHPIQFAWCSGKYGIFEWLSQWRAGDLRNPSWEWLLRDLKLMDANGKLDAGLLEGAIPQSVADALGLKKSDVWVV